MGPGVTPGLDLASLRAVIAKAFPKLAGGVFTLHERGWDSVAVDVDGRVICKFPRNAAARVRLEREAAVLRILHPAVSPPTPDMRLHDGPPRFSRHDMLAGGHLTPEVYAGLDEAGRDRLGADLGLFYAQLHALPDAPFAAAGAQTIEPWREPEDILRRAWPLLDGPLRAYAESTTAAWRALPSDPLGAIYGFFDGHGWNMAFDVSAGRLNGIYDFGDSGFGPRHQEFIYAVMIAPDAARRTIDHYVRLTGLDLDRERIALHYRYFRLSELAHLAAEPRAPKALAEVLAAREVRL